MWKYEMAHSDIYIAEASRNISQLLWYNDKCNYVYNGLKVMQWNFSETTWISLHNVVPEMNIQVAKKYVSRRDLQ